MRHGCPIWSPTPGPFTEEAAIKASPSDQQRLLELQGADLRLARALAARARLPEAQRAKQLAASFAQARDACVLRRTEAADLRREVVKAESEVERVRARIVRDEQLLASGSVTSAKQLTDLEHEIGSLKRRRSDLEDAELELMELVEAAESAQSAAEAQRDELADELEQAKAAAAAAMAALAAEHKDATAERAAVVSLLPEPLVALYERIRRERDGIAVAAMERGQCGGCRMQIVAADLAAIKAAPDDDVVRCEECRTIMVRGAGAF